MEIKLEGDVCDELRAKLLSKGIADLQSSFAFKVVGDYKRVRVVPGERFIEYDERDYEWMRYFGVRVDAYRVEQVEFQDAFVIELTNNSMTLECRSKSYTKGEVL